MQDPLFIQLFYVGQIFCANTIWYKHKTLIINLMTNVTSVQLK